MKLIRLCSAVKEGIGLCTCLVALFLRRTGGDELGYSLSAIELTLVEAEQYNWKGSLGEDKHQSYEEIIRIN